MADTPSRKIGVSHNRPLKICNSTRSEKKGIVCSTLDELKSISRQRFSLSSNCRVFLDSDGTEVDNEEYFQFLPPQTLLMLTEKGESWPGLASEDSGSQPKFDNKSERLESFEGEDQIDGSSTQLPSSLRQRITGDPIFFVSLSTDELHTVADLGTEEIQRQLHCNEAKAKFYQESCQQELDRRSEIKEMRELLKICQKAIRAKDNELQPSKKQKTVLPDNL